MSAIPMILARSQIVDNQARVDCDEVLLLLLLVVAVVIEVVVYSLPCSLRSAKQHAWFFPIPFYLHQILRNRSG